MGGTEGGGRGETARQHGCFGRENRDKFTIFFNTWFEYLDKTECAVKS